MQRRESLSAMAALDASTSASHAFGRDCTPKESLDMSPHGAIGDPHEVPSHAGRSHGRVRNGPLPQLGPNHPNGPCAIAHSQPT